MENNNGYEFGWDSEIENDSPEFILLPPGDYDFVVTGFERARHNGSDKLPPCPKAIVDLKISTPQGDVTLKHNLFLHSKTEGLLCQFFTAIGQRKHGEKISMNWNAVPGSTGRAKIGQRSYTTQSGEQRISNEISKFYDKDSQPNMVETLSQAGFSEIPQTSQTNFNIPSENKGFGGGFSGFGR